MNARLTQPLHLTARTLRCAAGLSASARRGGTIPLSSVRPKNYWETKVQAGTIVDLSVSEGRLGIAPVRKKPVTLRQLLAKVRRGNLHGEVASGPSVGREAW
jgi:antitoxin component of MazEF toxin-antitoxin module